MPAARRPYGPPLLLALLGLAGRAEAQEPRFSGDFAVPFLGCDCDTRDFRFRTTRPVPGYAAPDPSGPVVRTVAAGRLVEANDWDRVVTVVVRPGVYRPNRAVTLRAPLRLGRIRYDDDLEGEPSGPLTIPAGARVELLTGNGEGGEYFRYDGEVYFDDVPFPSLDNEGYVPDGRHEAEAEVRYWFRLAPRGGRPAAWVALDLYDESPRANVEVLCSTHGERAEC